MKHAKIPLSEVASKTSQLDRMSALDLSFVLVENFFSAEEIQTILADLRNIPSSMLTEAAEGYTVFPRTAFNTLDINEPAEVYFSMSTGASASIKERFSTDIHQRFSATFDNLNAGKKVKLLYGPQPDITFIPFNFRIMNPKIGQKATSHIHNGSTITKRCEKSTYQHLIGDMDFSNQLSFFCLLQNCKEGGDITIYDYPLRDYPSLSGPTTLVSSTGELIDLEATPNKMTVKMNPGDLILFPGGQLWHRVELVKSGERISLGGFAAPRLADGQWFYWI